MKHFGDITKLNGAELPPVDCICGGSPCQDLSIAGRREGLAGERSGLFMEQIRIIKEMREASKRSGRTGSAVRCRFAVWENVPGAFSSNKGKDFQAVLTEFVRVAEPGAPDVPLPKKGKWPRAGCLYDELGHWSLAWRVHDAQFWGAAQVVDGRVLHRGTPQRRKRIALVADFGGCAAPEVLFERKGVSWHPDEGESQRQESASGTGDGAPGAVTLRIRGGCDGGGKGPLIQTERSGALGTNQDQTLFVLNDQGGADAGSIGYEIEKAGTLEAGKVKNVACYDARGNGDGNIVPTITGDHENSITDYTAVCVGTGDEVCGDRMTGEPQARYDDVAPTVRSDSHPSGVSYHNTVRRLTPLECERLQGYPDGWTDIGGYVDSSGKKRKTSDTARYKALGNSIAIPFWFWLLRRISALYERPATLGSLFDGIGGFPLCWERCNGKGTAIWASEIEEFPIAVTKKHFPED